SEITGYTVRKYTSKPIDIEIPIFNKANSLKKITVPAAYIIPPQFEDVIEVIKAHQIKFNILNANKRLKVEKYRFTNLKFAPRPYEGRQLPSLNVESYSEHC